MELEWVIHLGFTTLVSSIMLLGDHVRIPEIPFLGYILLFPRTLVQATASGLY